MCSSRPPQTNTTPKQQEPRVLHARAQYEDLLINPSSWRAPRANTAMGGGSGASINAAGGGSVSAGLRIGN
jgi:hypothetical protein